MSGMQMKIVLYAAAAFNISGGLLIIFLLETIAPFVRFAPPGNMLFRLFVGGTAITFGIAYFFTARRNPFDPYLVSAAIPPDLLPSPPRPRVRHRQANKATRSSIRLLRARAPGTET